MAHFLKYEIAITQYSQIEGRIVRYASALGAYAEPIHLINYYYHLVHSYGFCQYLLSSSGPLTPAHYADVLTWLSTIPVIERLPDNGTQ